MTNLSRTNVMTAWFVAIALIVAIGLVAGARATPETWTLLLVLSLVPPAISFVIWRAPRPTVAEVLYAVENPR